MNQSQSIIIQVLQHIPLFSGLDVAALETMTQIAEDLCFAKDKIIFPEGSEGTSMMIIISGEVRITQMTGQKREEALCVLKKGDFFGEMAMLEAQPRSATAIAHSDAYLLEITRENFLGFIRQHPQSGAAILLNLARILSARLREADAKIKTFVNLSQWI